MNRIIISLLFLAASYYTVFFLAKPKWQELSSLKAEASSYKETLDNMEKMKDLRDKLLRQYNSISGEDKDKLSKMFASSLNEGELMIMFDDLAKTSSLTLTDIVFEQVLNANSADNYTQNSSLYNPYVITINVSGTYNGFKNFLRNMEKSLLITDINSISFNASGDPAEKNSKGELNNIYSFKIKGSIYLKN